MTTEVIEAAAPAAPAQQTQAAPQPPRQLSVVEHAMRTGASVAELRELMALQRDLDNHQLELMREKRRMDEEDRRLAAKLAFDAALSKLRGFNVIIPKTKEVVQTARGGGPGPRFWQSEYDVVCQMLSPALEACGLGFRHDMQFGQREWKADGSNPEIPAGTPIFIPWVTVTCFLTHRDGHTESLTLEGPPDTSGSKNPLQEMQSSASFLKRQSVLAITGTATGGEDDESAMRRREPGGLPKAQRREPDTDSQAALQALRDAGQGKATQGMKALTDWWAGLQESQRKLLTPEFGAMRQAARKFDEGAR